MRWFVVVLAFAVGLGMIGGSVAQSTRETIDLRTGPIINSGDVSNLALVLSVEFPTVKVAYPASSYNLSLKYLGYFNSNTCYAYNSNIGGLPLVGGYFQPNGATTSNWYCNTSGAGNGFSGNFMNFATMSGIDIVRFALTGGDRVVDEDIGAGTNPRTVLQRAVIPGDEVGTNGTFYQSGFFPIKSLPAGTTTNLLTPYGIALPVAVRSCNDKVFFGTVTSLAGSCTTPGIGAAGLSVTNTAGIIVSSAFNARVLVCDNTEGPVRTDLCAQMPDGNFKPIGEIQRNADAVRVAAFGYLLDQVNTRYGGVLRAPMKFAGPNQKSVTGVVSANPQKEWNENSGVFVSDPMGASPTFATSGVVNYLNKFGRTGTTQGIYKQYDPVGELYYESLRYYQGLQPTASATTGLTTAMLDGFPVYTNWVDPMQTACQRNYSMVVGDNNVHWDGALPGSTIANQTQSAIAASGSRVAFDAAAWTNAITSFETNGSVLYTDARGVSQTANGNSAAASSGTNTGVISGNTNLATKSTGSSNGSYLWAGAAYFANTQSIRSDKPNARVRTFTVDVDENGNGSIEGMGGGYVRSRAFYLAGKYGGFADVGADGLYSSGEGNPFKTYVGGTLTTSNNEWLAADSSTSPQGYFLASQPDRLITAIKKIFAEARKPSGNIAGGSLSVRRVSKAKTSSAFYQGQLSSADWSGTVVRSQLSLNTSTNVIEVGPTAVWDAANILTGVQSGTTTLAPNPTPANRKIFSYSSSTHAGISFTWASIDPTVQLSLRTDPATNVLGSDAVGQQRLDYIRGDRSNEDDFRARRLVMGDVINSAPVLKGGASADILDSSYASFYASNKNRTPTVYVGANDGMLHAFQAAESTAATFNGGELFAYVPRAVSEKLNKLTNPAYIKDAYVDATAAVNEAYFYRPSAAANGWGTVLASGMGGGAQGVFALDVTNPAGFTANNVLWEFTDTDDADIGNLISEPKIVKLATNGTSAATPTYKWYVMVTSGYNNYKTDAHTSSSTNGKQFLFLLDLQKTPGTAWALGTNYYKLEARDASFSSTTLAAGLAMPGVALDAPGNVKFAYAGDLQGNLWKFDLTGAASTWTGTTPTSIVFVAKDASSNRQAITVIPVVSLNPVGGYQISFGTGKFLEPNDGLNASAAQQSLYGIWDAEDGKTALRNVQTTPSVNGLISRTLTITTGPTTVVAITGTAYFFGTNTGQYRGWYVDFPANMERIAVDPVFDSGLLAINSTIPGGDPCTGTGGSTQYRMNPLTGNSFITTGALNTQGYLGSASLLEVGDTAWSVRSQSGRYVVSRKINSISPGVGGGVSVQESTVQSIAGRISWREITNFQ